jgi:hypothetical protein
LRILDLITPWQYAASDADRAAFRRRHATLLDAIRRLRAPTEPDLPLAHGTLPPGDDPADPAFHAALRALGARMADDGFRTPATVVLIAVDAPGAALEVIPDPAHPLVVLVQPRHPHAALAEGIAMVHRATDPAGRSGLARLAAATAWDKWRAVRELPLAEWVYVAGTGVHAAIQYAGADAATAVGVAPGRLSLLRESERALQSRLDADLDQAGAGLVLRWLEDHAPLTMRRSPDGFAVPAGAGRYLGWRMLAERVERTGLLEAAGMGA